MRKLVVFFTLVAMASGNFAKAEGSLFSPQRFGGMFGTDFSGIFSGDTVKKMNFGWTSTVLVRLSSGFCSGTLITSRFVITAAHCGLKSPQSVNFFDGEKFSDRREVVKTTVHPGYTADAGEEDWSKFNDLAILELNQPAPSPYAPVPIISSVSQLPSTLLVEGFGRVGPGGATNGLTSTTLNISSLDSKGYLAKLVDPALKQAVCVGDSGGPAYVRDGNKYYLAAVTSFIDAKDASCGDAQHSSFSVLVVNYIDWIKAVTSPVSQ